MDVTQDLVVTVDDCGTRNGFNMKALIEGGEVVEPLRDRILGRVCVDDVVNPETQETAIEAGSLLDEDAVELIERLGVDEVRVRTRCPARPVTACVPSATVGISAVARRERR